MATPAASRTSSAKKSAATKAPVTKSAVKKATTEKTAAKKTTTKKTAAKKTAAKKSTANRSTTPKKQPATKKAAAKKSASKKKTATKRARSPFSAAFLKSQKALLVEERATYTRQAEMLQAEADDLVADFVSGDSQFDEDGGEGDSLSSERERDLTLSAQARAAVDEIDHALAKFDDGTYGICEASGEPIPEERLEAIPWARVQIQYKTGGLGRL